MMANRMSYLGAAYSVLVMLLVCMDPREYRILSNGHAGVAIGPDQVDALCDFMGLYLPKGSYVAAFDSFAD